MLIVEDNADDEALALEALRRNKVRNPVIVARDGKEALDYLQNAASADEAAPAMPALVVLDLNLPRMSGLELLKRLRKDAPTRTLPVVILSASHQAQDVADGYRLGANSYIRKPTELNDFSAMVGQLAHYWLRLNEPPAGQALY